MIFKLLQGKTIEKVSCDAKNCFKVDVGKYPSLKEMEERADILAKLLILYNREEYPVQGEGNLNVAKKRSNAFKAAFMPNSGRGKGKN
jgi:hypothetical protein